MKITFEGEKALHVIAALTTFSVEHFQSNALQDKICAILKEIK